MGKLFVRNCNGNTGATLVTNWLECCLASAKIDGSIIIITIRAKLNLQLPPKLTN